MAINKENFLIDELEEKIYYGTKQNNEEELNGVLKQFLIEVYKRRRNDPIEGGLQAEMIIMPEKFAAKITENEGLGSHYATSINLLRFIKGESSYYRDDVTQYSVIIKDEILDILTNGIEIRILAGQENIMFAISSNREHLSDFQIELLENQINLLKKVQQKNDDIYVEVGFSTPNSSIEFENIDNSEYEKLSDEKYEKIMNAIKKEKSVSIEAIREKTENIGPEID